MRCGHCGEPLPADALFCGECGRAVQAGPTTPRSPRVSMVTPIAPPPPSGPPIPGSPPPPRPPEPSASPTVIVEPIEPTRPAPPSDPDPVEPAETSGTGTADAGSAPATSFVPPPPPAPQAVVPPEPTLAPPTAPPASVAPAPIEDPVDDAGDVDDDPTTVSPRRVPPAVSATIVASTGQRFQVGGRVLLGRRPSPAAGEEYDAVLVIVDEGKTVSKTHLELSVDRDRIMVTDLGSGNGTVIETPGEQPVRCVRGVPHPVPRGSRLVLGRQFLMIA